MKTPIQQLIEFMEQKIKDSSKIEEQRALNGMILIAKNKLEKERQMVIDAYNNGMNFDDELTSEEYFELTYNPNQNENNKTESV